MKTNSTFIILIGLLLLAFVSIFFNHNYLHKDKEVHIKITLENGITKHKKLTIPNYANLHIYSKNGTYYLQYTDLKGYHHTIHYGVIDFEIIK